MGCMGGKSHQAFNYATKNDIIPDLIYPYNHSKGKC
jgi:hypothetical protein